MIEARRIMYANFLEELEEEEIDDVSLAYFYMTEADARRCVPNLHLSGVNLALSTTSPAAAPATCFAQGFNWFVAVRDTANPTEVVSWGRAIMEPPLPLPLMRRTRSNQSRRTSARRLFFVLCAFYGFYLWFAL